MPSGFIFKREYFILLIILIFMSCSRSAIPVATQIQQPDCEFYVASPHDEPINNRNLWGFWLLGVDPENLKMEVIPLRSAMAHWNIVKWLEQTLCTNCFKVTGFSNSDHGTKLVDIRIKHPFSNANFTGFDVRGIAMFNGSGIDNHISNGLYDAYLSKFLSDGSW